MQTISIGIDGMTCSGCAASLERALARVPGISDVRVSLEKREARMTLDPGLASREQAAAAIDAAGFAVRSD